jgi:hypothetical protein
MANRLDLALTGIAQEGAVVPRLYLSARMIMDVSQDKVK